ncbi:hypothetical protein KSP35_08085 [Aquihabitans sp. G128]|uniref:hypothetical protein n=1 Tax=Aquihabitans sp. G128 TaxID=2849779 RepID=UPI001C22CEF8|nr:hypothetical protein [Aquihabitans sp. G128]QXC62738.1 hypothetical protein KSP35_08085 [Aquihabitans sp. G128]
MKLQAHGIETDLPPGWEGRIALRKAPGATAAANDSTAARAAGTLGEVPNPVVHLANFALPEDRGDFGSGAVDLMTEADVMVVLFEYGPEAVGKALFKRKGIPTNLTPNMFSSSALQRTLPGQAGCQVFFTVEDRAFCCYTVLGRQSAANRVLPQANATLAATRISRR